MLRQFTSSFTVVGQLLPRCKDKTQKMMIKADGHLHIQAPPLVWPPSNSPADGLSISSSNPYCFVRMTLALQVASAHLRRQMQVDFFPLDALTSTSKETSSLDIRNQLQYKRLRASPAGEAAGFLV
jgi:hypothetical protein